MPRPAEWFVRAIGILDPLLGVRYSDASSQYVIDRKAVLGPTELHYLRKKEAGLWFQSQAQNLPVNTSTNVLHQNRIKWLGIKAELESAEAERRVIFTTKEITPKTYEYLCASDIHSYGGYARFADDLEAEESRAEADKQRVLDNRANAMHGEVFDMISFLNRKKGALLDSQCMDMNLMLHGRKTDPEAGPMVKLTDF